jgi:hypothetical protein
MKIIIWIILKVARLILFFSSLQQQQQQQRKLKRNKIESTSAYIIPVWYMNFTNFSLAIN